MSLGQDSIEIRVQISRLDGLFKQSLPTILVSMVVVTLAWLSLRHRLAPGVLALWLGSVVGLSIGRALYLLAYIKIKPSGAAILSWERTYFLTLMLPVAAWGLGGAWAASGADQTSRFLILFFLFGMAGGAQGAYSSVRYILLCCIYMLLLPITCLMLLKGSTTEVYAASGAALYAVMVLRNSGLIYQSMTEARSLQYQLADEKAKIERLAMYDFLTGLNNRRAFEELSGAVLKAMHVQHQPVHLLLIDVDHFKAVNDNYGHAVGDIVLKNVASALNGLVRDSDLCARFGGEEFIALLPNTDMSEALETAERLRAGIESLTISAERQTIKVTISIGLGGDNYDLNRLIDDADKALYESKRNGRNRVTA